MTPDYSIGFANKSTVVTLLSVLQDSRPMDKKQLIQWLARPGISIVKANNTISLLVNSGVVDSDNGSYTVSDSFLNQVLIDEVEKTYKLFVMNSVPEDLLRLFTRNANILDSERLVWWVESISPFLANLRDFLLSLDLIVLNNGYMESGELLQSRLRDLNLLPQHSSTMGENTHKVTLEELLAQLELKDENGRQAEIFALRYEETRISTSSKIPVRVSELDVAAGYDIESYTSNNSPTPDRFIEVKAYSGKTPYFYWSRNEMQVAKTKGLQYFIYLVNLDEINNPKYVPIIIINPAVEVLLSDDWDKTVDKYRIVKRQI